jgi:thiamine biosynthesis lipoprotein
MPSRNAAVAQPAVWRFEAIGAPWQIDTASPLPPEVASAVSARIDKFDKVYSRFRADSLVAQIARLPGTFTFPPDADALFELYRVLYGATDGAITPLVGRALENLGYDAHYSLVARGDGIPTPSWDEAMSWHDGALTTVSPAVIDVGAAGKGYLADLVGEVLRVAGITDFIVDGSGDIVHAGSNTLRIGLEHPLDPTKAIGIASLSNGSLCASAANRRAWGDGLHHIVDVTTGLPASRVLATWAVAPTGLLADGLATALFLADPNRLSERFDFSWVRMLSNGRVEHSTNFEGEVFQ